MKILAIRATEWLIGLSIVAAIIYQINIYEPQIWDKIIAVLY